MIGGIIGDIDLSAMGGNVLELVAAGAVIVVVKLFLGHMKEGRDEMKSLIERNTTALNNTTDVMERMVDTASQCKIHQRKAS